MSIKTNTTYFDLINEYHINSNKFAFFVGAGLSQPLFPSWGNLLNQFIEIAKDSGLSHNPDELTDYVTKGENCLDIAEACIITMGEHKYRDLMEKIFDIELPIESIPMAYKELFSLAPQIIVTTNYDRIPDIVGAGQYRTFTNNNPSECSRAILSGKKTIFKMHGDISDHSSIVLKNSDYQKIINNNQNTRSFLQSLLSTRCFIFIGFSLSDPHINLILESLKNVNNNIPISHYILLNEDSSFKVSSFEKKYGIKIIQYSPNDPTHPEVIGLIRALSNKTDDVISVTENKKYLIDSSDKILQYAYEELSKLYKDSTFSIFMDNEELIISITPIGETKVEIQKEILSIIKILRAECNVLQNLRIKLFSNTPPLIDFDQTQQLLIELVVAYEIAHQYANKHITLSTLWENIIFKSPLSISDIFHESQVVTFPLNTGIVEI